jgi:hypothetical protein
MTRCKPVQPASLKSASHLKSLFVINFRMFDNTSTQERRDVLCMSHPQLQAQLHPAVGQGWLTPSLCGGCRQSCSNKQAGLPGHRAGHCMESQSHCSSRAPSSLLALGLPPSSKNAVRAADPPAGETRHHLRSSANRLAVLVTWSLLPAPPLSDAGSWWSVVLGSRGGSCKFCECWMKRCGCRATRGITGVFCPPRQHLFCHISSQCCKAGTHRAVTGLNATSAQDISYKVQLLSGSD